MISNSRRKFWVKATAILLTIALGGSVIAYIVIAIMNID